jgi:hypothetical protein
LSFGSPAPVVAGEAKPPPEKAVPEAPHSKALPGTCPDKIRRAAPVAAASSPSKVCRCCSGGPEESGQAVLAVEVGRFSLELQEGFLF